MHKHILKIWVNNLSSDCWPLYNEYLFVEDNVLIETQTQYNSLKTFHIDVFLESI